MIENITIGQYFPGNSLIHQLDPRVKLILLLLFIILIFMLDTFKSYFAVSCFLAFVIFVSKTPFRMVVKSVKPLRWIILFTFLIHLFTTNGEALYQISFISVTKEGLYEACLVSLRLTLLIFCSSLLTFTTSPIELTDGLESLFQPLKKIAFPAHEMAMMMTIALRFIPTLLEETDRMMKAQTSRGADFSSGNIARRVKNMIPLLVPLFISAFRRADDLAVAMEARCYRGGENRTRMKPLAVTALDYQALAFSFAVLCGLLALKIYG